MKVCIDISAGIKQIEKISKIILTIAYTVFLIIFAAAPIVCLYFGNYRNDYTTGYYWFKELICLCIHILGAVTIPVLVFELFLTALGGKKQKKE